MPLPSLKRLLVSPLVALGLLALPLLARAGYTATITGGTWKSTGSSPTLTVNDRNGVGSATSGGGTLVNGSPLVSAGSGGASCKDPMTAHLHWDGPGLPPPAIVVREDATARWSGDPGGACDPGLPNPVTTASGTYGQTKTAVRFRVLQNPGVDLDLPGTVEPTASASRAAGPSSPGGEGGPPANASANVSYVVTITPVLLNIAGTKSLDTGLVCLIGQKQIASVQASGYDLRNHAWNISANKLFGEVVTGPHSRSYSPSPVILAYSATDKRAQFYAGEDGSEDVACTFDVCLSGSATVLASGSAARKVAAEAPDYELRLDPLPLSYQRYDSGFTKITAAAVRFTYHAENPPDFANDAADTALCQLIDEHSTYTGGTSAITNGYVLDGLFPYLNHVFPADGSDCVDNDEPYDSLQGVTAFNINCQFATTCIYLPPGTGSVYVPLRTRRWSWNTTGYKSNGVWSTPTGGTGIAPQTPQTPVDDFNLSMASYQNVWPTPNP